MTKREKFQNKAANLLASQSTQDLADMLDHLLKPLHQTTGAEYLVVAGVSDELGERYAAQVQTMTSREIIDVLAPVADMREDTSPSAERRRTAYTEALIRRHPEADAAEAAWDAKSDEAGEGSEVFERGPAVDVIAAVEAVLGR